MKFDYDKLIGKIKEKFRNRKELAKLIGITHQSLSMKLNNHFPFTTWEIEKIRIYLDIESKDIHLYFFQPKVEKIQQ